MPGKLTDAELAGKYRTGDEVELAWDGGDQRKR
jgi:hypothetical protein